MPPTPPNEPAVPSVAMMDHVVVRPFIDAEHTTCFEQQPVPRPVLHVETAAPSALKVLDPTAKYKVKREVTVSHLHWFPPDGDNASSPVHAATLSSTTQGTADLMARQLFDGFNTTAVVCGHAKSGKHTVFFGEAAPAKADGAAAPGASPTTASPSDASCVTEKSGLVPRFATALFDALAKKPSNSSVQISLEIVELDDVHTINDLQAKKVVMSGPRHVDPVEPCKVKEESYGPVVVGAVRTPVANAADFVSVAKTAYAKYRKARTKTSGLHFVLAVRCQETLKFADPQNPDEQITKVSHASAMLALVVGRPTAFFRCVDISSAKSEAGAPSKVPVRESSLTRLIQDFFGGNSHSHVFSCVSPFFGHAKDVSFVLDVAAKLSNIRSFPRQSYDESTSEFRRLDREVSHLSSELHAATEAHVIIQNELDSRHAALHEAACVYQEQSLAVEDIKFDLAAEIVLVDVKRRRFHRACATMSRREGDLTHENNVASEKASGLDVKIAAASAAVVAAEARRHEINVSNSALHERQEAAAKEISRQEARYAEVEESNQGIGGLKEQVEQQHREEVGTKPEEIEALKAETTQYESKVKDMEMPLRMATLAFSSIEDGKKRLQAAKDRSKALDDEEARLTKEIADLEKEVEQMEKDAAPEGCCLVA